MQYVTMATFRGQRLTVLPNYISYLHPRNKKFDGSRSKFIILRHLTATVGIKKAFILATRGSHMTLNQQQISPWMIDLPGSASENNCTPKKLGVKILKNLINKCRETFITIGHTRVMDQKGEANDDVHFSATVL